MASRAGGAWGRADAGDGAVRGGAGAGRGRGAPRGGAPVAVSRPSRPEFVASEPGVLSHGIVIVTTGRGERVHGFIAVSPTEEPLLCDAILSTHPDSLRRGPRGDSRKMPTLTFLASDAVLPDGEPMPMSRGSQVATLRACVNKRVAFEWAWNDRYTRHTAVRVMLPRGVVRRFSDDAGGGGGGGVSGGGGGGGGGGGRGRGGRYDSDGDGSEAEDGGGSDTSGGDIDTSGASGAGDRDAGAPMSAAQAELAAKIDRVIESVGQPIRADEMVPLRGEAGAASVAARDLLLTLPPSRYRVVEDAAGALYVSRVGLRNEAPRDVAGGDAALAAALEAAGVALMADLTVAGGSRPTEDVKSGPLREACGLPLIIGGRPWWDALVATLPEVTGGGGWTFLRSGQMRTDAGERYPGGEGAGVEMFDPTCGGRFL
jgi:hypothetical protein